MDKINQPHNHTPYQQKPMIGSSHFLIRKFLTECPPGSKVLDVGTANGLLGQMFTGSTLLLYGIEPIETWARAAMPFYEDIFIGSLEEAPDQFLEAYDIVVCTDVLEHIAIPNVQLSRLVRLQKSGTKFIISVPNIANIWIRMNLLFGRFDYTERGILDYTHLRFFTLKSFKEVITESNLVISKMAPTPIPLELIHPFFQNYQIGKSVQILLLKLTQWFPTLLGYQFFCHATK
jgi:SAM-dependent methyltransferase